MPITAAGTQDTSILNHSIQISFLKYDIRPVPPSCSRSFFVRAKGHICFQNSSTTARMAPSCITTSNMPKNSSLTPTPSSSGLKGIRLSTRIRCPVLLMGSHSVMPSTIP